MVYQYSHTRQKVPCTFDLTVPGLGYIDGNIGADVSYTYVPELDLPVELTREQMKQGTKVDLPLWLGEMLAVR